MFMSAEHTFKHQYILDPTTLQIMPLNPIPDAFSIVSPQPDQTAPTDLQTPETELVFDSTGEQTFDKDDQGGSNIISKEEEMICV